MNEIGRLQPKTVLDLGCGWGKYGVLCRELLDIMPERLNPGDWNTVIVGVEGFRQYKNPNWQVYDEVHVDNFAVEAVSSETKYRKYDLVLLIDSLEHIDKATGHKVLDQLIENNKHVIVSCPTGANYLEQGAVYGNEFERHRAHWTPLDFEVRGGKILHNGVCVVASIKGQKGNPWLK